MSMLLNTWRQYRAGACRDRQEQHLRKWREQASQPARGALTQAFARVVLAFGSALHAFAGRAWKERRTRVGNRNVEALIVSLCLLFAGGQWVLNNAIERITNPLIVMPESLLSVPLHPARVSDMLGYKGQEPVLIGRPADWEDLMVRPGSSETRQWRQALDHCVDQQVCQKQSITLKEALAQWREPPVGWARAPIDQAFLAQHHIVFSNPRDPRLLLLSLLFLSLFVTSQIAVSIVLRKAWRVWVASESQAPGLHLLQSIRCLKVAAAHASWSCATQIAMLLISHTGEMVHMIALALSVSATMAWVVWGEDKLREPIDAARLATVETCIENGAPVVERRQLEKSLATGVSATTGTRIQGSRVSRRL